MKYLSFIAVVFILSWPRLTLADERAEVAQSLDTFHRAASVADKDAYFAVVTDDIVFLGTDGSERWQGEDFREFVSNNFTAGRGWVYTPVERNISLSADGKTAWFDESLHNDSLGRCRGSGVAVRSGQGWRIAQYNLSVPVPNEMVEQVVAEIAAMESPVDAGVTVAEEVEATGEEANPALEQVAEPPPPAKCRKKRHKTNRKGGC